MGNISQEFFCLTEVANVFCFRTVWTAFIRIFADMPKLISEKPKNPVKVVMERFANRIQFRNPVVKNGRVTMEAVIDETNKFKGIGDNKKLAKVAAAKCVIRELKKAGNFLNY